MNKKENKQPREKAPLLVTAVFWVVMLLIISLIAKGFEWLLYNLFPIV